MVSKSTRNLSFLLLGVLVLATLLVIYNRPPGRESSAIASGKQTQAKPPASVEEKRVLPKSEEKEESPGHASKMEEDAFAVVVEGKPLLVTLPWYNEIGQISIEKYDGEGNATGKPLESGTMVQIPDPFKPGERIRFVVP